MTRELTIGLIRIADDADCFVIAEIGHNHQGDVAKAKELFREAKAAGVQAVKLQKRDNRSLFTRDYFDRPYDNENSFGPTYGLHREALEFDADEYGELQRYAKELGLLFFATAFDEKSAEFLARLDVPAFKIASGDIRNIPLLERVAEFGRPMIVSTGTATMEDVCRAHAAVTRKNQQVAILQCTATYPAPFEVLDLAVIRTFREAFPDTVIGFSGHDNGIAMALVAYVLGARVIEKHFTLNRAMKGTDHAFSLEPTGMRKLVRDLRRARIAIGDGTKRVHPGEVGATLKMGKKLVAARALPAGHVLRREDIAIKTPGDGIAPFELPRVLGRALRKAVDADANIDLEALTP